MANQHFSKVDYFFTWQQHHLPSGLLDEKNVNSLIACRTLHRLFPPTSQDFPRVLQYYNACHGMFLPQLGNFLTLLKSMGKLETPDPFIIIARFRGMRSNSAPVFPPPRVTHSSVCVSVSSSDGVLVASLSVSVPPPLPAQRNSLPVQSATATLAQAEKMKEIDKYCENVQVRRCL